MEQATLGRDFDALWPTFEGQKVTKVILTFAGEVDLSQNQDLCRALDYLGEVEFTISGRITGKKHSYKQGATVGTATMTVERIDLGGVAVVAKGGSKAAKEAIDVTPDGEATPAPKKRGRPKKAAADEYRMCGKMHSGHLSACTLPWNECEIDDPSPSGILAEAQAIAEGSYDA